MASVRSLGPLILSITLPRTPGFIGPLFTVPSIPVSSGGLHPGLVPDVLDIYGTELVLLVSGGIHGHP